MRYHVLATDYDGTIATDGRVDADTIAALERLRRSGRRLVLVTGRVLADLASVFPRLDLFESVVAENGGVIHRPATRETRALAAPPPERFMAALRQRGVAPLDAGRVIVATWQPHEETVLDVIRTTGLELQVIFNKGAVMVLPSGVNKAFGLEKALAELDLSPHNAVGVGDAENDHAFLAACECRVAVANALASLKESADLVTAGDHGRGVQELVRALVDDDLGGVSAVAERTAIALGERADGAPVTVPAYGPSVLIAGRSGSGKSLLASRLLEQLVERGYQCCIVDPEGDYRDLAHATALGDASAPPRLDEALELLAQPAQSCVLNLLGVPLADRPAFFDALLPRLQELRARTGRPHWIVVDEAHHLFPPTWAPSASTRPAELTGLLLVTVHPERIAHTLLADVARVLVVGEDGHETLAHFADAAGVPPPPRLHAAAPAPCLAWDRATPAEVVPFTPALPRIERRRHVRKYAAGDLGPERSFYFRGPDDRLNLRAPNLQTFVELADGVDDDTWRHHLERGDYSRWFRDFIKDDDLARETETIERDHALQPLASRARVREAIERRYTAPA